MRWNLIEQTEKKRTYQQERTGSRCHTELIEEDETGGKWWGFVDLFSIPYLRQVYAKKVTDLFSVGLQLSDLKTWFSEEKELLRSNDPEKYEKLYAKLLEKEATVNSVVDPEQQHLALASIYVLADDEPVDYLTMPMIEEKLRVWGDLPETSAFFLSWHLQRIERYFQTLNSFGRIASKS